MSNAAAKPAVFFDRDNTLIVSDGYLGDPAGVKLMRGAAGAVARARALGFAVVVVSNQSGVARGLFTEDDVRAVDRRMAELLLAENKNAKIDRHDFCPFHPAAVKAEYRQDSELRKPKPGMYLRCLREMNLSAGGSWAIGDAPRDVTAGRAAGLRTILFRPEHVAKSPAAEEPVTAAPDFEATTLEQAMSIIERETAKNAPAAAPVDTVRLERQLDQILGELKKANAPDTDFSIPKLLAGIVQILVVALMVISYVRWDKPQPPTLLLLLGILLQCLVTSLLIMGRQK